MENKRGETVKLTIFVLLLLIGAFFAIVPGTVAAAVEGDYSYELGGIPLVATITGYSGAGGAITIPSSLGGYSTRAIGDHAFDNAAGRNITMATIPFGVVSIGNWTFASCAKMTSVMIPNSVTSIGTGAFASCTSLTSAVLPEKLTIIDSFLFSDCTALRSADIPKNVTSILTYAFNQCSSLTSVSIPNHVTDIGYGAFISCTSLTSVTIGDGATVVATYAFFDCIALRDLNMGRNITRIGMNAFSGCSALNAIIIPGSVTTIGAGGFAQCSSLARMQFDGDAPSCGLLWNAECSPGLIAYYRSGAAGFSDPWEGVPTVMMTPPSAPLDIVAVPGSSQVMLSWAAPSSDGNCSVRAYEAYYGAGDVPDRLFGSFSPTARTANITGLQPAGTVFCFAVRASNDVGASPMSDIVYAAPYTVPGAPTMVTARAGAGKVTISWHAPGNDGGRPVSNYTVYRVLSGGAVPIATIGGTIFSIEDANVTTGSTYFYYVVSINIAGPSVDSEQASAKLQPAADNTTLYLGAVIAGLAIVVVAILVVRKRRSR